MDDPQRDAARRTAHAFAELASRLRAEFLASDHDEARFAEIATRQLEAAALHEQIDGEDVLCWAASAPLPPQLDPASTFGDPPITVYQDPRFVIDVYTWFSSSTAIHQHGFSGAFTVLTGSSLHTTYGFEPRERINARFVSGDLQFRGSEVLTRGAVTPIRGGARGIHALFHLDHPSFSVVVRTQSEPDKSPQYEYLPSGLAFDPFYDTPELRRKVECLHALLRMRSPRLLEQTEQLLRRSDCFEAFLIMIRLQDPLDAQPALRDALAEALRSAHGRRAAMILQAVADRRRTAAIRRLRKHVTDPAQRFVLAVLMNVPTREQVLSLVRSRFPEVAPAESIANLLRVLSERRLVNLQLDDTQLSVTRALLESESLRDALHALAVEYELSETRDELQRIQRFRGALRRHPLLSNVLREELELP